MQKGAGNKDGEMLVSLVEEARGKKFLQVH